MMKKSLIGAIVLSMALAVPVFAADNTAPQKGATGAGFEERKADVLKRIDARMARIQQEKDCVNAAKSHDELKACRDKYGPPGGHQGMMKGPMGPGGSGHPGGQTAQ
ncbi:MAG: hypothetical protein HQK56_02885 [Deltaproteobacteria bacterium]|nr:hypothetical protein [Deltaproteobacteria bacterium]